MKRLDDIIIANAEKGGSIVIQDVKLYNKETERQLNKTKNYRLLPIGPTKKNNTVNKTIKRFQKEHLIKDKPEEKLMTQNPRTPRFI